MNSAKRSEPSKSVESCGSAPAVKTFSFGMGSYHASSMLHCFIRTLTNPRVFGSVKNSCSMGFQRTPSTNSTSFSACASATARLAQMVLLPSPGLELLTTMTVGGSPAEGYNRLVRNARYASEAALPGPERAIKPPERSPVSLCWRLLLRSRRAEIITPTSRPVPPWSSEQLLTWAPRQPPPPLRGSASCRPEGQAPAPVPHRPSTLPPAPESH